jgi:ferric-dicitrate binding protein FerR (iron transport regulator)
MEADERRGRATSVAADWWVRWHSEELSRFERERFVDWLCESYVHVAEMLRVSEVHCALAKFDGWSRIATDSAGGDGNVVPLDR